MTLAGAVSNKIIILQVHSLSQAFQKNKAKLQPYGCFPLNDKR